jgi:hypothetical protein
MQGMLSSGEAKPFATYENSKKFKILSQVELTRFDDEGDPRDICLQAEPGMLLGMIKPRADNLQYPEYLLLANIHSLCQYGKGVSKRFSRTTD